MKKTKLIFALVLFLLSIQMATSQIVHPECSGSPIVINGDTVYLDTGGDGPYLNCDEESVCFDEGTSTCISTLQLCASSGTLCIIFDTLDLLAGGFTMLTVTNGILDTVAQGDTIVGSCLTFNFNYTSIESGERGWRARVILKLPPPDPGDCNLVCNDHLNISMPADTCYKVVEPDDLLENPMDGCIYQVDLAHPFGTDRSQDNAVNRTHIGYTFIYSVYVLDENNNRVNSCWGYVTVEDKAPPQPMCKDVTISCFQVEYLNRLVNTVVDNCAQNGKSVITSMTWTDWGCDSALYIGQVVRTIVSWDTWGNSGTCNDTLTIRKDSLELVKCPDLIELDCEDCDGAINPGSDKIRHPDRC